VQIRNSASATRLVGPLLSNSRSVLERDCGDPFSHSSDQPFAPDHSVCDIGGEIPLWKCGLLAHRTQRAVVPEEAIDAFGMEDVAARKFADDRLAVLEIIQTD
jgi:hypothetical protein